MSLEWVVGLHCDGFFHLACAIWNRKYRFTSKLWPFMNSQWNMVIAALSPMATNG